MKELADASVLVLQANKARATGYVQLVQMAGPELYLPLQVNCRCIPLSYRILVPCCIEHMAAKNYMFAQ